MYKDSYDTMAGASVKKFGLLKNNPLGYFMLSILAGMYIGFAILLAFTIGSQLGANPFANLIKGLIFGVALSLVVIPGAELFTGNNLVMGAGVLEKKVTVSQTLILWIICWIGNLLGAVILAIIFNKSGLQIPAVAAAFAKGAAVKMTAPALQLFLRGVLCNILVCLAVWSSFQTKSDPAKLIMIFWTLLAFFATGFEHSVANMTTLVVALLNTTGNSTVTMGGLWFNLLWVSLGNVVGGVFFVALPYWLATKNKVAK